MPAKRVSTVGASPGWVMIQKFAVSDGFEEAVSDLCWRQTGRPCEALADHEAHRLSHLRTVLETQRGRPPTRSDSITLVSTELGQRTLTPIGVWSIASS